MAADITSNLEAHWKLDDGTGGTLVDSANGHDMSTPAGRTWQNPGKVGGYNVSFAIASSQYGTVATWVNIQGQGAMTFSFWFKSSTTSGGLLGWGTNAVGQAMRLNLEAGTLWMRCNTATGNWGNNLDDGLWHHVCITKAANATMNQVVCVIDNVTRTGTFTSGGTTLNFGNVNAVYLGYDWGGTVTYLNGQADDVRIYTRQLATADITALFNLGLANIEGATGWWTLDETSGATSYDSSGNAYHGTTRGSPTQNVTGAFNRSKSYTFSSASTQYIGTMSLVNASTNAMTMAAWIKPNGTQSAYAGVLFSRGGTVNGLLFDSVGSRKITYCWNNNISTYTWAGGPTLPDLAWSHVALVVTPAFGICYVNGAYYATNVAANTAIANPFGTLEIARDSYGTRRFNGSLDDVRIYPRSLDARDIYKLYQYKPVRRHGSMYFAGAMLDLAF